MMAAVPPTKLGGYLRTARFPSSISLVLVGEEMSAKRLCDVSDQLKRLT